MSDSTEVGRIVAYLQLASSDYDRGMDNAARKADELGKHSPNIRISTNTAEVIGQLAAVQAATDKIGASSEKAGQRVRVGLVAAIAELAPAAVPMAAVTAGALAGIIPVAATVALGVKGITKDLKDGALAGTEYGRDLSKIKAEGQSLQQIAAGGILSGIDRGLDASHGLFAEVNKDIALMSSQIGDIIAGGGPALLKILTDLNPLFVTLGDVLSTGANELESWAENSTGITGFVSYVQAELPEVLKFLGDLLTLLGHLAAGAAPVGDALLRVLDGIAQALDAIPVNVITDLTAAFVLLYPAIKTVALLNAGLTTLGVITVSSAQKAELATAQYTASSLRRQAAVAAEAAATVRAEAQKAEAILASERMQQTLLAGTSTAMGVEADAAVANAERVVAAKRAEAAAAERSAAQIKASAAEATAASTAQADAMAASSRAGRAKGGALLGLAGVAAIAYIAGKALASYIEKGNSFAQVMNHAGAVQDSFNESLLESKGAIDASVTANVQAQIQQAGLAAKAARSGITMAQLTAAITGNNQAFAQLVQQWEASGKPSGDTIVALGMLHLKFGSARDAAQHYASQQGDTNNTVMAGTKAFNDYRTALHQTEVAILALGQTELAQAASEDAFKEGLLGVRKAVHDNGTSLSDQTKKGLANRDMLIQLLQQANAVAQSQQKNHVAIPKVTNDLIANVKQLEQTAVHAGLSKDAVQKLVAQMHLMPKDIRSTFKTNARTVIDEVATIRQRLHDLTAIDWQINMFATLHGGIANVGNGIRAKADGGYISGPGSGTSDSIPARLSNGEFVVNARSTSRNRALLDAINSGAQGFAPGGPVGHISLGRASHQYAPGFLVSQALAGAVAPSPSTVGGWRAWLAVAEKAAVAERAQYDAAKASLQAYKQRAHALGEDAAKLADQAANMKSSTKAERALKDAAEDRAKAAKKVADAADQMASRAQKAYNTIKSASQSATAKAKQDAQSLVAAVQASFETLQRNIQGFQSGIVSGLTGGSDLATVFGNLTSNVDSTKQALDAAQSALEQATPDTSKLAAAQAAQAQATAAQAAAHAQLTQALAGGDAAAILAAQQAQTTAAANLADAQQAVQAATPTPDQLAAQAQAQAQLTA
ncbi:MAG TPA: hypothetical protein VHB69_10215, partial [Mycobacteriales bacterium]|nr:hypothetical protein [Mycobacteriales bacterium]